MVFLNNIQKETLFLIDDMINDNKTFDEIETELHKLNYQFRVTVKNGYIPKTKLEICKNGEYTFVDLRKKRNGFAYWETIRLS